MAAFNGYLFVALGTEIDTFYRDDPISSPASVSTLQNFSISASGPLTSVGLFEPAGPAAHSGYASVQYREMFHSQVYIVPNTLVLGSIIADLTEEVDVWNAYLSGDPDNELLSIGESGTDTLILSGLTAPKTFKPGESVLTTLDIPVAGAASLNAVYTFNFTAESPTLTITGNRVAVWAFEPNWETPVKEKLEWLTDVIKSDNDSEQVIALRSVPRTKYTYKTTVMHALQRRMQAQLWGWQPLAFVLPVWSDKGALTADITSGDLVVNVDTTNRDYADGGMAVVIADQTHTETVEILSVGPSSLTLVAPTVSSWPAGTTIYPGKLSVMEAIQPVSRVNGTLDEVLCEFVVTDNRTDLLAEEFSGTTYLGYPVLDRPPNWRGDRTVEYTRKLAEFDAGTGPFVREDLSGLPATVQDYLWTLRGRDEIFRFKRWLLSRAGRVNRIWVPTFQVDLVLDAPISDGTSVMTVENIEYTKYLSQDIGRRDIRIQLKTGENIYKRIISSLVINESQELLNLSSIFEADIPISQVYAISFIQLSRMASDTVELSWLNGYLQECKHSLRSVNDDV